MMGQDKLTTSFYTWPESTPLSLKDQNLGLLAAIDIMKVEGEPAKMQVSLFPVARLVSVAVKT